MIAEYEVIIQITAPKKPVNGSVETKTFYPGDKISGIRYQAPPEVKIKPSIITYDNYLIPLENLKKTEMAQTQEDKVQEDVEKIISGEFGKNITSARKNMVTYGIVGTFLGIMAAMYFNKSLLGGAVVGLVGGIAVNKIIVKK